MCNIWWSQIASVRTTAAASTATLPHAHVRPRAQLLEAAARQKSGTAGGSQIWNLRTTVCVTLAWAQVRAMAIPTSATTAPQPHVHLQPRAQLLEAALRHRCGIAVGPIFWHVGDRVYVTPAWSQLCAMSAPTAATTAPHPHAHVQPRAQLLAAAARHRFGTAGGSKIWNLSTRVFVTPA